jgi:hypothetical protein
MTSESLEPNAAPDKIPMRDELEVMGFGDMLDAPGPNPSAPLTIIVEWYKGLSKKAREGMSLANMHDLSKRLAPAPAQGVDVGKLRSMWDDADDWHTKRAAFELALQALSPSSERLTSAIAQLDAGEGVERELAAQASSEGDERSCTCHPDDAVEPCARKYAASECAARAQASLLPPVGWVMVPVEPTEAMIDAAEAALGEWRKTLSPDEAILRRSAPVQNGRQWMASATPREKAAIRYAAMIAAAPTPVEG